MSSDGQDRFFIVDKKSNTHATIERILTDREAAYNARWDFLYREFPESKKKGTDWSLILWESAFGGDSPWGIKAPNGTPLPPDWKLEKRSGAWLPRNSTKRGKELVKEMRSRTYVMPGTAQIGKAIGTPSIWEGMTFRTIGIQKANDGRWILSLHKTHKVPAGATRISDIDVEKLTAKAKRRKKPAMAQA